MSAVEELPSSQRCLVCGRLVSEPACGVVHAFAQRGPKPAPPDPEPPPERILSRNIRVHAMAGRCILQFPPPITHIGSIEVPDISRLRREIGTLVAIGAPRTKEERQLRREIMRRTGNTSWLKWRAKHLTTLNRWLGWKKPSARFLISMLTGGYYWRKEMAAYGDEFAFLQDIRVYNITDLPVAIVDCADES